MIPKIDPKRYRVHIAKDGARGKGTLQPIIDAACHVGRVITPIADKDRIGRENHCPCGNYTSKVILHKIFAVLTLGMAAMKLAGES